MHYICYTKLLVLYFIISTVQGINDFCDTLLRYVKEYVMFKSTSGHPSRKKLKRTQLKIMFCNYGSIYRLSHTSCHIYVILKIKYH